MNDSEWIEIVKKITDPLEMLKVIVDNEQYFGHDQYYNDLRKAMLDQAAKIIECKLL